MNKGFPSISINAGKRTKEDRLNKIFTHTFACMRNQGAYFHRIYGAVHAPLEEKMKKAKHYVIMLSGFLLLVTGLCLVKIFTEPQWFMRTLPYLCIGIGCGMFAHGLSNMINKKALEKDPELARQMHIEVNDERNIQHANLSKAKGFTMMTYIFSALLLVYAFMGVSPQILIPFVLCYLFVQFYALYHRLKIDKEQ